MARYIAMQDRSIVYEIVAIEDPVVRIQVKVYQGGRMLGQPAIREERRDIDPLARQAMPHAMRRLTRDSAEAAGKAWSALLYEDRWTDEKVAYARRTWVSPDVPIFGTVRMELYGDGQLEASLLLGEYRKAQ